MRCIGLISKILLDLIYPPRCAGCNSLIPIKSKTCFCDECKTKWDEFKDGLCPKCGQLIRECWCSVPGNREGYVDREFHLVSYNKKADNVVKKLIYNIKNYNDKRIFYTIASEIYSELYGKVDFDKVIITAVPRSKRSKRNIGHDQSVEIAHALCRYLDREYTDVFYHVGNLVQKKLSHAGRAENAAKSYKIKNGMTKILRGKEVLLIDDVVTTGSTVVRCASLLKKKGAEKVTVFSIAKTAHYIS